MSKPTIDDLFEQNGFELPAYAWPGGYPIYYQTADGGLLCPTCANNNLALVLCPKDSLEYDEQWAIVAWDVMWEYASRDEVCYCDNCGLVIDSAYGIVGEDEDEGIAPESLVMRECRE